MAAFGAPGWRGPLFARSIVKVGRRIYAEIEKRVTKKSAARPLATEVLRFAHVAIALTAGSMKVGLQRNKDKISQEFWALFTRDLSARFPKKNMNTHEVAAVVKNIAHVWLSEARSRHLASTAAHATRPQAN